MGGVIACSPRGKQGGGGGAVSLGSGYLWGVIVVWGSWTAQLCWADICSATLLGFGHREFCMIL